MPRPIEQSEIPSAPVQTTKVRLCRFFERVVQYGARKTGLARMVKARPSDFGIFVRMIRR